MARVALPESRLRARRKRRRARLLLIAGAAVLVLAGALVGATYLPFLQIREVQVMGAQTVPAAELEAYAREQLAGRYAYLFPKRNIFLYPKRAISAGLLAKYPELYHAEVRAENFHTVAVNVVEREPKARWCTDDVCYLMDQGGAVYASALGAEGLVSYRGTAEGDTLPKQYLTPGKFEALFALADALSQTAGAVAEVAVDNNEDVIARFESGFRLRFVLGDAGGDVFERFNLALTAGPFLARDLADFDYLDLRFGDKLYYELK